MCVGHQVHVEHVRLHHGACLHRDPKYTLTYPVIYPKVKKQAGVGLVTRYKINFDLEVTERGQARPSQEEHTHSYAHRNNSLVAQLRAALIHTLGKIIIVVANVY